MRLQLIGAVCLVFCFTNIFIVSASSLVVPKDGVKETTTPVTPTPDGRDIISSSRSATATSSLNESSITTPSAPELENQQTVHEMRSPTPIIRGTIDNDPRWWKTSERYEIARIDGYNESYLAEEPIIFSVAGKSDRMDVTKENGFYLAGGLDNLTDISGDIAVINYITSSQVWQVRIPGKRDATKQYEISLHLLCGGGSNSPCSKVYGNGTAINKILPLQIR